MVVRGYLLVAGAAAVTLPLVLDLPVDASIPVWVTAAALTLVSVLNVEISRMITGGLARTQQPHKALSAWAFACALLLPPVWLLLIVPTTYAHARWRSIRVPLWKWVGSAAFLVLAAIAAALVRYAMVDTQANWMHGDGGRGLATVVVAAVAFLAVETLLFSGSALLNDAADEVWLRQTLTSWSFYATESGVLVIGGLLSAVWTGGAWFTLLFIPVYVLAQRASLHEPLRERAATAAQLARKNEELELANRFKIDLMSMLSHEIGNPLTAVQGWAQLAEEAIADEEPQTARKALAVIERNAVQIRAVLYDIFTMVSSDRGALAAAPEPCLVHHHLSAAASGRPPGMQPEVECPEGLLASVQPGHFDQILVNLLSNADKYAGGATRVSAVARPDGQVEVRVEDCGPGVPTEFRDHLFQRFSRGAETAPDVLGSGLGLFITRELARANGGEVRHSDRTPAGSVFVVTLPQSA
ncbi:sensor histidine kinase [Nocardioides marmorisolisilvae]|uniref:histidine kinase n=1 Tax=Nocardioides marmorisolisilvae TaxID=1542737 RepID=A0A3N0DSZ4_9ACTN|nr:sensor histidine kinase [Nocardioides marmorisolisilvae]